MTISIITPVYNTDKYLHACIDSILSQSYTDFELLLVDDGSTDKSGKICDDYAQKDSRIRVFHKANGGVASARNVGLENAQGEWVCFVDSDDTIPAEALSYYSQNTEQNIDLIFSKYKIIDEEGIMLREYCAVDSNREFALPDFLKEMYASGENYQGYICDKLFRMSVIREHALRFNEQIFFNEDRLFTTQYACASKKPVRFMNHLTYRYLMHSNSAMASLKRGYNRKFVTDFDALVLMKKAIDMSPYGKDLLHYTIGGICNSYEWNHGLMLQWGVYDSHNHWHMLWGLIKSGAFISHFKSLKRLLIIIFFPLYYIARTTYKKYIA